jgi:hypothetical protein
VSASIEWDLLEAIKAALAAITTVGRVPEFVEIIDGMQTKYMPEAKPNGKARIMLVQPGDVVITEDTSCRMLYEGDVIVTGIAQHVVPEDLKTPGYEPTAKEKLLLVEDIKGAVNGKNLVVNVPTFIANRNMDIEVDGFAVVQVQVAFRYTDLADSP